MHKPQMIKASSFILSLAALMTPAAASAYDCGFDRPSGPMLYGGCPNFEPPLLQKGYPPVPSDQSLYLCRRKDGSYFLMNQSKSKGRSCVTVDQSRPPKKEGGH